MCSDRQCFRDSNHDSRNIRYTDIENDISHTSSRGYIPITPQMIRIAIKRLQLRRVYVNSNLIGEYLRHNYPVNGNTKSFKEELNEKLECAVRIGLIIKHGEDAYYLPTLRQEANSLKTAFTAFWETYINSNTSSISTNRNRNKKKSTYKRNLKKMIE